jgi:hypothetical protein
MEGGLWAAGNTVRTSHHHLCTYGLFCWLVAIQWGREGSKTRNNEKYMLVNREKMKAWARNNPKWLTYCK